MNTVTRIYCTYFDSQYLARGMTMLRSLQRWDPDALLLVLALDDRCATVVHEVFGAAVQVLRQQDLLAMDAALRDSRDAHSYWSFYAMHKPVFLLDVLGTVHAGTQVIFLDADTWFFSDPSPVLAEAGMAPIALSPHRFSPENRHLLKYGKFNAGFLYLRATEAAWRCLTDWRKDCLEWCEEEPQEDGRFMNQGYMNHWPERYRGVHVLQHPGANLAPWNVNGHHLERSGDGLLVDGQPLIFYHFSQTQTDAAGNWYSLTNYFEKQFDLVVSAIYEPYARAVAAETDLLTREYGVPRRGTVRAVTIGPEAVRIYPRVTAASVS